MAIAPKLKKDTVILRPFLKSPAIFVSNKVPKYNIVVLTKGKEKKVLYLTTLKFGSP